ncbi:MAG: transglycosylase domain-containing protein [Acidimicrobiales bacterium]
MRVVSPLFRLVLVLALGSLVLTTAGLALGPQLASLESATHGVAPEITLPDLDVRSYVYSSDGTLIATLQDEENRAPIDVDDIPQHVIDAILSVEDADFFQHQGVDARATARALLSNVETGGIAQGGSTITQQLVKQALLTSDRDFTRKTKEVFLAVRLEKQMSKMQILEQYLNTIYLGNHSYGIQAAAETYFGVAAAELDIAQAALLAGMIRDPIDYNPFADPEVALERRRIALRRMVEEDKISEEQAAFANEVPLPASPVQYTPPADDYFVEEAKRRLLDDERLGETRSERTAAVFKGGLEIHTTLDLRSQYLAALARNDVLDPVSTTPGSGLFIAGTNQEGAEAIGTSAIASVEPGTGAVRTLIGGPGFTEENQFNLATQGFRQPGSAFKTFVLLSLLEQGYSPSDRVSGAGPCVFDLNLPDGDYEVDNFGNSRGFVGTITSMTTNSSNCGYIRLGQIAGIDNVVELAGELGLQTRDAAGQIVDLDPAIASTPLGTQGVTPLAMAGAYAAIANDGYFNPPYLIERVIDRTGRTIFRHTDEGRRVFSIETAQHAGDILKDNVLGGTGGAARVSGHDIGGKTGTAQDFSNAWFAGFSRQLSTAVWMGAIEGNVPMFRVGGINVTGGSYPARIFGAYMNAVLLDAPPIPFADPPFRQPSGSLLQLDREIDLRAGRGTSSRSSTNSSRSSRSSSRSSGSGSSATTAPATTAPAPTTPPIAPPPSGPPGTPPPTTPGGDFEETEG